jgi:hypothetical protein
MITQPEKLRAPKLIDMPAQTMAVVQTTGDPNKLDPAFLGALYGAVYGLKFALKTQGREFKVAPLRARWPDAHLLPKEQWTGLWALPVPDDTTALPQKNPAVPVRLERWEYGPVAQILHLGPYSTEAAGIVRLHQFITERGYHINGMHEEEYLTRPTAKVQKTLIRYPVVTAPVEAPRTC